MNDNMAKSVGFIGEPARKAFFDLKNGRFEGKELASFIERAISGLKENYTLRGNGVEIVSIILEWLSHKEYERRFKY